MKTIHQIQKQPFTESAEAGNVSAEVEKREGTAKYIVLNRDGYIWIAFQHGVIRKCAERCGVSCQTSEWDTIAAAYNGTHSSMGYGNMFFFNSEQDARAFAELVSSGDISGYYGIYITKLKAECEQHKQQAIKEQKEFDEAMAYFAELDADSQPKHPDTPTDPVTNCHHFSLTSQLYENIEQLAHRPKLVPRPYKGSTAVEYITTILEAREIPRKRHNSVSREPRKPHRTILRMPAKCSPANPPPIGSPPLIATNN